MRFVSIAAIMAFFTVIISTNMSFAADSTITPPAKTQYLQVQTPFASVYKQLDPKSEIVEQAKKGDFLEILGEGTSWYLVQVNNTKGWVEKRSGKIVNSKSSPVAGMILGILFIAACVGGAYFYFSKNKVVED